VLSGGLAIGTIVSSGGVEIWVPLAPEEGRPASPRRAAPPPGHRRLAPLPR